MLTFFDNSSGCSRRDFLTVGSLAGLSLPALLAAKAAGAETDQPLTTGKSVIFLFQHGGPSQFETWDPKMDQPDNIRTVTGCVQTAVPGLQFGGTFPKLASRANKLAIVRNFQTESGNHDIKPLVSPASLNANIGSLYSRIAGTLRPTGMPTNCALCPKSIDPQGRPFVVQFGNQLSTGSLGSSYAPFTPGSGDAQQNMSLNLDRRRLDDRRTLLRQIDTLKRSIDSGNSMASVDRFHEQAYDVILNGVANAFDLSREDPRLLARYNTAQWQRTPPAEGEQYKNIRNNCIAHAQSLGKLLLLARRLCEEGAGFVLINTAFVWDMHSDANNFHVAKGMEYVAPVFDHAVSTFIDDVEARGLSDKIMLVATGEMGRTPRLNATGGRDHWGKLAPLLFYGGGMTRGQVIGRSTRDGGEPAGDPQMSRNLVATILHTLLNPAQVRLAQGLPADLLRAATEVAPIPGILTS